MNMKTTEKLDKLTPDQIISLYQGFSGFLLSKLNVNPEEILEDFPSELKADTEISEVNKLDPEELDTHVVPGEVIPVAKAQLYQWAENPQIAPLLDEYMETFDFTAMAAGTILALGTVLLMTIVSTSVKFEIKDGKKSFSYSSENISKNAVELVKAVLSNIPVSLKKLVSAKD